MAPPAFEPLRPNTRALGRVLEVHAELGSTNDRARTLARMGAVHGLVVVADRQTQGRGQRGRVWDSPEGAGLYVSYLTRPRVAPRAAPGLTLLAGLALYEAVTQSTGADVAIKWPNDLLAASGPLAGRKLAGVLVEATADAARVDHAIIGVGINLRDRPWPPELEGIAASLAAVTGQDVDRAALYVALTERLEQHLEEAERDGLRRIFGRVAMALAGRGERVALEVDGQRIEGELRGVAEDGALLLDTGPASTSGAERESTPGTERGSAPATELGSAPGRAREGVVVAFYRGELRLPRAPQIHG